MNKILLLCSSIILVVLMTSFVDPDVNPVGLGSDGYEYLHLAKNLREQHRFDYTDLTHYPLLDFSTLPQNILLPDHIPCTVRVPGYPATLALIESLWYSPYAGFILNFLCYLGICFYSFLLGRIYLPSGGWQFLFNILIAFSPLYLTRWGIGADFLASFLLTGFIYHILQIAHSQRLWLHTWIASFFAVSSCLTRSNLIIFVSSQIICALMIGINKKNGLILKHMGVMTILMTLGIGGWMLRNASITGTPTLSTQGGYVLYTVHLGYDNPQDNPKVELFSKHLSEGKSLIQTELAVDQELKQIVKNHYQKNPWAMITKSIDGLRTLFLFSYFDISDVLVLSFQPQSERMTFANSSSSQYNEQETKSALLRQILFQASRVYKWLLLLGFVATPFLLWMKRKSPLAQEIFIIYCPTLLAILSTAILTGAGGDRLRLPFNVPLILSIVTVAVLFLREKIRSNRS